MSTDEALSLYQNRKRYTLREAAIVWAHVTAGRPIKILDSQEREWSEILEAAERQIEQCVEPHYEEVLKELSCDSIWVTETFYLPDDLEAFTVERGKPGTFIQVQTAPSNEWGYKHDTELLECVRWVIKTYWENTSPDMWPTKELVIEKLNANFPGLSEREVNAVDLVTRHDSLRKKQR